MTECRIYAWIGGAGCRAAWFLALALLAFYPALALGQRQNDNDDDSYVPIPVKVESNRAAQEFLDRKLGHARTTSDLDRLARAITGSLGRDLSDEEKKQVAELANHINVNDPETQELMRKVIQDPNLKDKLQKQFTPEQLKEMDQHLQGASGAASTGSGQLGQPPPQSGLGKPPALAPPATAPEAAPNPELSQPTEGKGISEETARLAGKILGKTGVLEHPSMFKKTLEKLSQVRSGKIETGPGDQKPRWLPNVARIFGSRGPKNGPSSFLSRLHLPKLGGDSDGAALGEPDIPSASTGSAGGLGTFLVLLLTAAIVGGAVYYLSRLWQERSEEARGRQAWRLGPWPLDPATVRTPGQLIQAFEYLALLVLGRQARSRNHREIAGQLENSRIATPVPQRQAARVLAGLYEQARYAPPDEPLSPEQFALARRDLVLLAASAKSAT